jgi:hypothetical protein
VGKPDGKRILGRPTYRWEDSIKIDLQEVVWGLVWVDLTKSRNRWLAFVNEVMGFQVPLNSENLLTS